MRKKKKCNKGKMVVCAVGAVVGAAASVAGVMKVVKAKKEKDKEDFREYCCCGEAEMEADLYGEHEAADENLLEEVSDWEETTPVQDEETFEEKTN